MRRILSFPAVTATALCALLVATPGLAEAQDGDAASHAVSEQELRQTVVEHAERSAADRAALRRVLRRAEVRRVAGMFDLDLRRAEAAAATLEGEDLKRAGQMARQVEAALVGGDTIVISATTLIIILLVLIIILVA